MMVKQESGELKLFNMKIIIFIIMVFLLLFPGIRLYNMLWNNRTIETSAYKTNSYATGLYGHIEFTKYYNGSMDVKIYPGFAHRLFDSKLYQDLDGDSFVDRIRINGAEWKMNHLSDLLVREYDYKSHINEFNEADKKLQGLILKYSK